MVLQLQTGLDLLDTIDALIVRAGPIQWLPEGVKVEYTMYGDLQAKLTRAEHAVVTLTRERERLIAQARLDEAKWWEHLVGLERCEPDCAYCDRISNLTAALAAVEKEAKDACGGQR